MIIDTIGTARPDLLPRLFGRKIRVFGSETVGNFTPKAISGGAFLLNGNVIGPAALARLHKDDAQCITRT